MIPEEIRERKDSFLTEVTEAVCTESEKMIGIQGAQTLFLGEIAEQLAELNVTLRSVSDSLGSMMQDLSKNRGT